jgi:2,4-dienoyl-CoA reductase-like NADH-dependent reductase (Old Yellow Enzyme family)
MELGIATSAARRSSAFSLGHMALAHRLFVTRWGLRTTTPLPLGLLDHRGCLLISEPLLVGTAFESETARPALCTSEQVNRWRELTCATHQQGGFLCAQLTQSAMAVPAGRRGPSDGDLQRCFEAFRNAAENAFDAGFDGIELAAGPGTVGGQLLGIQSTLTAELLQVLLDVWGSRCCLGMHLGADDFPLPRFELDELLEDGLAWLHIGPCTVSAARELAPLWRRRWGGALLLSGDLDAEAAQAVLNAGSVSMVGAAAGTATD